MAIQDRRDTYIEVKISLDEAYANFSKQKPVRVILGEYETVGGQEGIELPGLVLPNNISSGIAIHNDALDILNENPLTAEFLAHSKGQKSSWQLTFKAPSSDLKKKFDAFLIALAQDLGCTVESLEKQGYSYAQGENKLAKLNFPSKDMASLFMQMLKENIPAHQLFSSKRATAEEIPISSMRP